MPTPIILSDVSAGDTSQGNGTDIYIDKVYVLFPSGILPKPYY